MPHNAIDAAGAGKGSALSYLSGYVLAILLTLAAFLPVMTRVLSPEETFIVIFAVAAAQILVHLRCFLHLDGSSEQRWNRAALLFTALILVLIVGGEIWIMFSLHARTMLAPAAMPSPPNGA
ncbi:MAG TPA: cytochrome o ubiquinol oxidase subunit IV [Acetobacteraceae bacterium]|nr:cytochrome o ubiquinol oxidase subunit IV [Acetobacteraceae bacterium]